MCPLQWCSEKASELLQRHPAPADPAVAGKGDFASLKGGIVSLVVVRGGGSRDSLWLWWILTLGTETAFQQLWVKVSLVVKSSSTACHTLGNVVLIRERNQELVWKIHLNSEHWCNMNSEIHVFWLVKAFLSRFVDDTSSTCRIALCGERKTS